MSSAKKIMEKGLERKLGNLRKRIRKLDSALVAFSGGVDSTFLTRICREELGEKAVAVTALSDNYPRSELSLARRVAKIVGVRHMILNPSTGDMDGDSDVRSVNVCRGANMYSCLKSVAMRLKVKYVIDGSHSGDVFDRGARFTTAKRAGVRSPLLESDLSKAEIRLLAKELGLPNWDKPASSKPNKLGPKVSEARDYLADNYPGAKLRVEGTRAILSGSKLSFLAKTLTKIEKKLLLLGFSEVLLKTS
jgi:PP-loop superfamily ATP-utilizing enzyme